MRRTIAIIAPFIDSSQFNLDYCLRLKQNDRELTLAAFYEWAGEGFRADRVSRGVDYGDDVPAAGFYLQGLLHLHGYDTILTNKFSDEALQQLTEKEIFAVCISTTMIITTGSLLSLFASVRRILPGVPIIAGGVNIWKNFFQYEKHLASPEDFPMHPEMLFNPSNSGMEADVLVVAQHGIGSLLEVLRIWGLEGLGIGGFGDLGIERFGDLGIERFGDLMKVPNLCFPGREGFVFTEIVDEVVDYNEDFTRWDLIDEIPEKIPVRTSIGCPYRCRFCDFCRLFPKIFLRSKESLLKELSMIKARLGNGLAVLHVTDDNVFITKKRLFEVCGAIEQSKLNHWVGFMRGGEYTAEEMEAIKRSGLMMGKIGVESGDQGQLDRMNKRQKAERVKRGIEQLDASGISTLMTFVVGFPGETEETLENTARFLNDLDMTNLSVGYQVYPLLIMPLSELAEPAARKKWRIEGFMDQWSHCTMDSGEALAACHQFFRKVTNVPYSYSEESYFFNRGMFDLATRRKLFQLRQQVTINLMDNAPWDQTEVILREMTALMELPVEGIGERLRGELCAPV